MEDWEKYDACTGRSPLRGHGNADLADNPEQWERLWDDHRDMLLAHWISDNPGTRPPAWHKFDAAEAWDEESETETEPEYLHRLGLLAPEEVEAVVAKARTLAEYNRCRNGNEPTSNFIPPRDAEQFAIDHGLLSEEEKEILSRLYTPRGTAAFDPRELEEFAMDSFHQHERTTE